MPKYMHHVSFTTEGARGILKEGGTSRRETIEKLAASMGGSIEAFYFAFGEDDVIVLAEYPDIATVTAVSLAVSASGAIRITTTPLIEPEEVDRATKITVDYRAPGA